MKKKHLRCLLVLLVAVCMVCSIAVPVCAEVLPSAQIGTPETALESDTEKDNTPTPHPNRYADPGTSSQRGTVHAGNFRTGGHLGNRRACGPVAG